jgi:hypothetical protein
LSSVTSNKQEDDFANSVQKGRVLEGYESPVNRLQSIQNNEITTPAVRTSPIISIQQQFREEKDIRDAKSSFDNFKSGVYATVDFVTGPAPSSAKKNNKQGNRSDNDEITTTSNNSTLTIPSKPSFNQIREQEARARAAVRNEKIRAKKEDLYRIVDSFQASVDALPETFDKTEEAVKEAIQFSKTIPEKIERTVQEIQAIPDKVEKSASETQRSIQKGVDNTRKIVKDVQDIPNKVNQSVLQTKKSIENTQESVQEAVTNVKVLIGIEKPKPKPPKKPPPPQKKPKEIALSLAGKAAGATGKLAWWTTKGAASLAWKGAQVAYSKGKERIGPALEEAKKKTKTTDNNKLPSPPSTPPQPSQEDTSSSAGTTTMKSSKTEKNKFSFNISKNKDNDAVTFAKTPEELAAEIAEAQALAKEVEEALEMAERALLITNEQQNNYNKDNTKK